MDNGSATATGLKELSETIDRLPATVTAALRGVAHSTSVRIQTRAHDLAPFDPEPRGTHTEGNPHLRDAIVIEEDTTQKQFRIFPNTPWLPELGLWIERGTVKMSARPFMRPAGDGEDARYKRDSLAAAERVVTEALK